MKVAPSLEGLLVEIDSLIPWPGNPRQGDVGAIVESLRRFGQQKPIVVQASSRYIVAGNHLWRAAKALGWNRIAANVVDLSDREAEAFLVADNRTAELGSYDNEALGSLLERLAQRGDLKGTGYDGDDVDAFLSRLAKDRGDKGELRFATELMEAHNYVVLYFDNEMDWASAQTKFGLETVRAPDATDSYDRRGVGRVIPGGPVLGRIRD